MAYFANGSDGDYYEAKYCARCVHGQGRFQEDGETCPVMVLHFLWNYDSVGANADKTKATALETLWPRDKDRIYNGDCRMFIEAKRADGSPRES
jgi:hypothetical protein